MTNRQGDKLLFDIGFRVASGFGYMFEIGVQGSGYVHEGIDIEYD